MHGIVLETAAKLLLLLLVTIAATANVTEAEVAAIGNASSENSVLASNPVIKRKQFTWPQRCIVCNSMDDENCASWLGYNYIRNCSVQQHGVDPSRPTTCRKIVQSVYGNVRVVRQCSNVVSSQTSGCIERVGTMKIKVQYCHCSDRDACNIAPRATTTQFFLVQPLLVLFLKVCHAI